MNITGRLENWNKGAIRKDEFIIWGDIYDDVNERWKDGTRIHTSGIKQCELKEGELVDTRNSVYLLGKKRPEPEPLTEEELKSLKLLSLSVC